MFQLGVRSWSIFIAFFHSVRRRNTTPKKKIITFLEMRLFTFVFFRGVGRLLLVFEPMPPSVSSGEIQPRCLRDCKSQGSALSVRLSAKYQR